jgi:hypothetical protein
MRKLIVATALLAMVTSASAIGVGISAHYNIGMPLGPDSFKDNTKMSIMGFQGDVEIAVHPFINVVAAFGYQVWKPKEDVGIPTDANMTLIPINFGIEYPAVFGNIAFYPGGGMSYNMIKYSEEIPEEDVNKIGIWFGGNFYYMVNPKLGVGAGVAFNMIFTEDEKTTWIHIPIGMKYWFM